MIRRGKWQAQTTINAVTATEARQLDAPRRQFHDKSDDVEGDEPLARLAAQANRVQVARPLAVIVAVVDAHAPDLPAPKRPFALTVLLPRRRAEGNFLNSPR